MIQVTPQMRILVAIHPEDFRKNAARSVMRSIWGIALQTRGWFHVDSA
jgi:hypothetical protein